MHLRKALLQSGAEIEELLKRQVGMQSADDVKLRDGLGVAGSRGLEGLVERHGVGTGRILLAAESAQAACGDADIGRIDMAVDVEVSFVAMHALADEVRHPSDGQNVAGAIQRESVVSSESLTAQHFGVDRRQPRIVSLKCVGLGSVRSHLFDDIALAISQETEKPWSPGRPRPSLVVAQYLLIDRHAVANLRIFVLRQHVARHQLARAGVGALGDDALGTR